MRSSIQFRRIIYWVTLFFIVLSGFGQMPVFKRYYIADIPGLGWLAKFYVTHLIHYASATVLIALAIYVVFDFFFNKQRKKLSIVGYIKLGLIGGLILSGGLMVIRNLPGVHQAHSMIIFINITHLGLCMILLLVSLFALITKKKWQKT